MTQLTPRGRAENAHKVIAAFRLKGAVNGACALPLSALHLSFNASLRDLIDARVVRRAGAERFFIDEAQWARRRRLSGRTLARLAAGALMAGGAFLLYFLAR